MLRDVRYAIRSLGRAKAFTAGAVLTLALGIGVNSTMFALASAALFRPIAGIDDPSQVVWISATRPGGGGSGLSYPDYIDYRAASASVFTEMAAYSTFPMSLGSGGTPERIRGAAATGSLFSMLGVRAVLGRLLASSDDAKGGPHVAVITNRLWKNRFGGSPDVLKQPLVLNGREFTVVGVIAGDFRGPSLGESADVWVPLALLPDVRTSERSLLTSRSSSWLLVLGRLRPGVGVGQAQAALSTVALDLRAKYPEVESERNVSVSGAGSAVPPNGRAELVPVTVVLVTIAGLVLAIACANIANLLLARGASRAMELSIRASLGASRYRLVRQLLTESAVIAAAAGGMGLLMASWAADTLVAMAGPEFETMRASPDWRVLAFTIGVAVVSVSAFALVPAFAATRPQLTPDLRAAGPGATRTRLQAAFMIAQLALSVVLLLAAGLGLRALQDATSVDLGFTPDHLATASYDLVLQNYTAPHREAFRRDLLARVRALGGVESAAIANIVPLGGIVVGGMATAGDEGVMALMNGVSAGYFSTMGIPIVRGREFVEGDLPGSPVVVVLNETAARRFWPNGSAVSQRLRISLRNRVDAEVVGVARDSKYDDPTAPPQPSVYLALAQEPVFDSETLIVRTIPGTSEVGSDLERMIRQMDPALPVFDVRPFAGVLHDRVDKQRALSFLFSGFGVLALLLAAVGLYGLAAHGVAQRTRELGVRLALGATPAQLGGLIARDAIRLGLFGTIIGSVLALPLARLIGALVFGIQAADVAVFVAVCALLNAVVLAASLLPARRAARLQPIDALRTE